MAAVSSQGPFPPQWRAGWMEEKPVRRCHGARGAETCSGVSKTRGSFAETPRATGGQQSRQRSMIGTSSLPDRGRVPSSLSALVSLCSEKGWVR